MICAAPLEDDVEVQAGTVSVIPTAAAAPEAVHPIPSVVSATTPPYPAFVLDALDISARARTGAIFHSPVDNMDIAVVALNGVQRVVLLPYFMVPEELNIGAIALAGVHKLILLEYSMESEKLDVSASARNGVHRVVLLPYLNYIPESLNVSCIALNGTRAVI